MTAPDTSPEAIAALALKLPFTQWMAPRLYTAADTLNALSAERDHLAAQVVQLQRELDAANARAEAALAGKSEGL